MMNKMVYLDYAATSPVVKYPSSAYGPFMNPNANYAYEEKRLLRECEERVKVAIGAKSGKVIFGGTSSQLIENLVFVIDKTVEMNPRKDYQFLWSPYEHDSIDRFNDWGDFYVDSFDKITYESDMCKYDDVTPFVLWQGVNNITGEIFPIEQIGNAAHANNTFYICDATALLGHTTIESGIDDWCDVLVMSGHKLGTELGIGAMWISDRLDNWLNGFKLHGTPNLAGALAMAQAVEDVCDDHSLNYNNICYWELLNHFIDGLVEENIDFQLVPEYEENEPSNKFTFAINAIHLPGFNADSLQQFLATKKIYIGIGHSSCAGDEDYRILEQYGLTKQEASEVIRVSFGEDSTVDDVDALIEGIKEYKEKYL